MSKIESQTESDGATAHQRMPLPQGETGIPASRSAAHGGTGMHCWLPLLLVGLLTLVTFLPALRNGFVNWDDDVNIVENEAFRGFSVGHVKWMFTTTLGGHYQPLTWLSYAVDDALWGDQAFGYHLSNVVFHVLCAVLFCFVARRLLLLAFDSGGGSMERAAWWCAAFAAAVFAVHPLRVESVAWVTERRDVLSGVLVMGCVLAYLRSIAGQGSVGMLALSLLLFAASLLAKATALALPVVLLVIDIYPGRRLRRGAATPSRVVGEKVPYLLLAAAAGVEAVVAQRSAETMRSLAEFDVASRVAAACRGVTHYLYTFVVPTRLSPLYLMPERRQLLGTWFLVSVVVLACLVALAIVVRRKHPAIPAALICFAALLAPVSGIAQSGVQFVADRYTYLPLLPAALLLAGGLLALYAHRSERQDGVRLLQTFSVLACVYIVALAPLAAAQATVWESSIQLWRSALQYNPDNSVASVNLGDALRSVGQFDMAEAAFEQAARLDPKDHRALNGKGVSLLHLNRPVEALESLQKAVALAPRRADYRCNLGFVLAGFQRFSESADQYEAVLRLAPGMELAYRKLGGVYEELGRYADARRVFAAGLERAPNNTAIRGELAWLLATCSDDDVRDGEGALALAKRLCVETNYGDPFALDTLAAAQAACGKFDHAVESIRLALAQSKGKLGTENEAQMRQRLELYERGEDYRK